MSKVRSAQVIKSIAGKKVIKSILKRTSGKPVTADPFNFQIYIWNGEEGFKTGVKEIYGIDVDTAGCSGYAMHLTQASSGESGFVAMLPEEWSESTTWHEALHICWFILDECLVKIDADNHEIQCYLQEHLVDQIRTKVYGMESAR